MKKTFILLAVILIAGSAGPIFSGEPTMPKPGDEGGICMDDETCNAGFVCKNDICQEASPLEVPKTPAISKVEPPNVEPIDFGSGGMPIAFPDKSLESAIKNTLDLNDDEKITDVKCKELKVLDVPQIQSQAAGKFPDVSSLKGIEFCTNISVLNLSGQDIADISPLAKLSGLVWLDLKGNKIEDITALSKLKNLQSLSLSGNKIKYIDALKETPSLVWLGLSNNEIRTISSLTGLSKLKNLYLAGNNMSNKYITPLAQLTGLVELDIGFNYNISDINPLKGLKTLARLNLDGNLINDISPVKSMTGLNYLVLSHNKVTNLYPLALNAKNGGLGEGDELYLSNNPYPKTDMNKGAIDYLKNLKKVKVWTDEDFFALFSDLNLPQGVALIKYWDIPIPFEDDKLREFVALALGKDKGAKVTISECAKLTALNVPPDEVQYADGTSDCSGKGIKSLKGLEYCSQISFIQMYCHQISDITPLAKLSKLKILNLSSNQISNIKPLENLADNLGDVGLQNNQISDISPLAKLNKITFLLLGNNKITDISPLVNLTNLTDLYLQGNQISDIFPLLTNAQNGGLGAGDVVFLNGNPLCQDGTTCTLPADKVIQKLIEQYKVEVNL